jgi:hypothetical protein
MRIAVISTGGTGSIASPHLLSLDDLYTNVGFNTGNLAFWHAVPRLLSNKIQTIPWHFDPTEVGKHFDHIIFPAANQVSEYSDLSDLTLRLEQTNLPFTVLGIGAQAPRIGARITLRQGTRRFLALVRERSKTVAVRGHYTAEILTSLGLNVKVTGCPSFFINTSRQLGVECMRKLSSTAPHLLRVAVSQGEVDGIHSSRLLTERQLFEMARANGYPYITQSPYCMLALSMGLESLIPHNNLLAHKENLAPHLTPKQFIDFFRRSACVFFSAVEWMNFLHNHHVSIGGRVHSNLLAMQAGTLGVLIPHDSRTAELVQAGCLPFMTEETFGLCKTMEQLISAISFSPNEYDVRRMQLARSMTNVIESAGLTASASLRSIAQLEP